MYDEAQQREIMLDGIDTSGDVAETVGSSHPQDWILTVRCPLLWCGGCYNATCWNMLT